MRQAVAAVWTGRWGVPEILGGVSAKALSLEKIREKLKEAVASISGQFTTTEHGVPTSANIETLHATVLDAGKRATEALVLVTDLEKALDSVRLYTFSLGDSQKRISEQLALLDELLPKSPTFDQLRNLHRTISREINNAKTMISKQQEVVKQLSQIQNQIAEISAQGVDTKEFRFAFETMVDEVFQRTIVNQELGVLADAPTTKSKIEYLQTTLGNLYQSIEDQEQIIQQSKALNELDKEIAELTNLSVKSMSQLMEDRQNLSATLYTPDDDKDAKTRIDEMLRDIDSVEAIVLAQMQLILKLETTLINIRQLKAKGLEVNDLEAKLKTLVDVLFQKTIIDQELLPQEIGDKIQGPYEKIERIKKAFSAVIQTTDQIKRDEVRLVNDVMNDMEHALAHATRYVEKHKNSFVHKLLCKLSSPYRSTFELLEKAIGAKDESLEKGFQYISEALDIKQGKTMTTIMRHSLKGIKKFADGVLASQTYLDHHNTSEDQDCSDDQANQVRI